MSERIEQQNRKAFNKLIHGNEKATLCGILVAETES